MMEISKNLRSDHLELLADDAVDYIHNGYDLDTAQVPEISDSLSTRLEVVGVDLPAPERLAAKVRVFGEIVTAVVASAPQKHELAPVSVTVSSATRSNRQVMARPVAPPTEPTVISRLGGRLEHIQAALGVPTGLDEHERHQIQNGSHRAIVEAMENIEPDEHDDLRGLFFSYIVGANQPDDTVRYAKSIWRSRTKPELLRDIAIAAKDAAVATNADKNTDGLARFERWRYEQLINLVERGDSLEQNQILQLLGSMKKPQIPPIDFGRRRSKLTAEMREMRQQRTDAIRNAQHRELTHVGRQIRCHQADPDIIPPPTTRVVSYNTAD